MIGEENIWIYKDQETKTTLLPLQLLMGGTDDLEKYWKAPEMRVINTGNIL